MHRLESLNAFVACAEPHDHGHGMTAFAICDKCGQVAEFSDHEVGEQLDDWIGSTGFVAKKAVIEFRGTCAKCLARGGLTRSARASKRLKCASSQLSAARASTCSGTVSATAGMAAFSMTVAITGIVASTSSSADLEDQLVMHLQQHARRKLGLARARRPCGSWRGG